MLSEKDWRNNGYNYEYDPLNRLIEKKDRNENRIEKLVYNHNNAQIESYDALNNRTQFFYDKNNRLTETIDPEGHKLSQQYDQAGNIFTKTNTKTAEKNCTTEYTYDWNNQLLSVKNALGEVTAYTYDAQGNMLTQKDGNGHITTYLYNVSNKLSKKIAHEGTGNSAKTESYTYYPDGSLKAKTDRNDNTTEYTYDIHGRLQNELVTDVKTGITQTRTYTYDNNGNQRTVITGSETIEREYDRFNRVTKKTVSGIGTTQYMYDLTEGLPEGYVEEETKVILTTPTGTKEIITQKTYNEKGWLKYVKADGETVTYNYYDNGNRANVIYPNQFREEYTYFSNNQLKNLKNIKPDSTVMDSYSYTYDLAGNQDSKSEIINGVTKGTTNYTYDDLNRLDTITEPSGRTTTYTYDAAGNRLTETIIQGSQTVQNTYQFNATNTYDLFNQLIKTVTPDTTVINTYNGEGLRVAKEVNGEKTHYLYEYNKVILEVDGQNNEIARNIYGLNLLKRTVGDESYFYLYNGHGDVTALVDSAGNIAATYYYDAFGNIIETTGNVNNSITYAGYQYDQETGLYYLNSRMYDPKIARFLQEDTYWGNPNDPLSLNLYTYCRNEPIKYTDPDGHFWMLNMFTAFIGGAISTTSYILGQKMTGQEIDIADAIIAFGAGAVTGALMPTKLSTQTVALVSAVTGSTSSIVSDVVHDRKISISKAIANGVVSYIAGRIGGGGSKGEFTGNYNTKPIVFSKLNKEVVSGIWFPKKEAIKVFTQLNWNKFINNAYVNIGRQVGSLGVNLIWAESQKIWGDMNPGILKEEKQENNNLGTVNIFEKGGDLCLLK